MTKTSFLSLVLAALAAAAILAGCGSSDSSSDDPAAMAPAGSPLYIEATIQPTGKLQSNIEELAKNVAGVDDVGEQIVSALESSAADDGEELDFDKEIKPWLGEKAGLSFQDYDGEDFKQFAVAIQTTDPDAASEFVEKQVKKEDGDEEGEYEGNTYFVEADDDDVVGVVGDFVLVAEDKKAFESAVDASDGENLAGEDEFSSTFSRAVDGSLTDLFVDVGALIEQSGGDIDPQAQEFFESSGIKPEEATAVASLVPGSDQVEIDISSDFADTEVPAGDAAPLLETLPGKSFAALGFPSAGDGLQQVIDTIDENGIPGEIPPNKFKSTIGQAGIDLDEIAESLESAAAFGVGRSEQSLEGALVLTMDDSKVATETVTTIRDLLGSTGQPGVKSISGDGTEGFEVAAAQLGGSKPLVVAARDKRLAIGYGSTPVDTALSPPKGATLGDSATYKEAVSSLDGAPISAFVDGPGVVALVEGMLDPEDQAEFAQAKPYLQKLRFASIGSTTEGDVATAKLIVGVGK